MSPKRKGHSDIHAAARLVQRYSGAVSMGEIYTAIAEGKFDLLVRQSHTRWLCKALGVYFIWGVKSKKLITVLSPRMAASQIRSYA